MPELPEVEIIRRGLERYICGEAITQVDVLLPRQIQAMSPDRFSALLRGRVIERVDRRGKYLLLQLSGRWTLVIHLRMTGRLVYEADGVVRDPYARVVFSLSSGADLVFGDVRTFGVLYLLPQEKAKALPGLASLGPEPLSAAFTPAYLHQEVKGKKAPVKSFLLQQEHVAGIGNIYADEALFVAGIHPARHVDTLSREQIDRLHDAIQSVLRDGIADGGTTFRDYKNAEGGQGHHQEHLHVYEREGLPCENCGSLIKKMKIGGRGTRYCPRCQS